MPNLFGDYNIIGACGIRVAQLADSGAPVAGDTGWFSDQLVSVDLGSTLSKGDSLELKNGCGGIAATSTSGDTLQNATLKMVFANDDAGLMSILLPGSQLFTDSGGLGAGSIVGFQAPGATEQNPGVCVELWTKAWDETEWAVHPSDTGATYKVYVFPRTKVQFTGLKLENNFGQPSLDGTSTENTAITINGPFDDWPADIAAGGGITRAYGWYYSDTIPTATHDFIPVTAGS